MCARYKRDPKKPIGSAHCIIFSKDFSHVLIVHDLKSRGKTKYSFPGGKRKIGEGYKTAAVRETKEETGLNTSNLTEVGGAKRYFENGHYQTFFIVTIYSGNIRVKSYKNETGVPMWTTIHEVLERKDFLHFVQKIALAKAVNQMRLLEKYQEVAFELSDVVEKVLFKDNLKIMNLISHKPR